MNSKIFFVEFSLCDGDERPYHLSNITDLEPNSSEEFFKHIFSIFFEYSPDKSQTDEQYSVELVWDGITNSPLHSCVGVQAFGIRLSDQSIAGGPSPILKFELEGDIDIGDFINQWSLSCSPKDEYFYENWSGYKRILAEEELERRGLVGDHSNSAIAIAITEGTRSTGESFVFEKSINCEISWLADDNSEDWDYAEQHQGRDELPDGWFKGQVIDLSDIDKLDRLIVDKLISDVSVTHKDLIQLATHNGNMGNYGNIRNYFAMLAPMHPLSDHEVIKSYWEVYDDGDMYTSGVEQVFELHQSLPPSSPWRYCRWIIEGFEPYAQDLLEQANFEVDPKICKAIFEYSKCDDCEVREIIHSTLAKVVNLSSEIRDQLDVSKP